MINPIIKELEDLKNTANQSYEMYKVVISKTLTILKQYQTEDWVGGNPPTGTECLVQTVNDEIFHVYYAGDLKYHFIGQYKRTVIANIKFWRPLPKLHE